MPTNYDATYMCVCMCMHSSDLARSTRYTGHTNINRGKKIRKSFDAALPQLITKGQSKPLQNLPANYILDRKSPVRGLI